ncbi:MAG: T9SS type A sorting domain-containing protein [Flavobacteriales bacterium]|nr:T9SS type A sorting domain-containing protein [Flavobacteriales bacterium]
MRKELLTLCALLPWAAHAQDGQVDPTFADNAVYALVNHTEFDDDWMKEIVVLPDGRILLGGNMGTWTENKMIIVRLLPDGTRDSSFGTDGVALVDLSPGNTEALKGMVPQGDKLILGGQTNNFGTNDFFVMRLNADGSVDESFGGVGVTIVDVGNGTEDIVHSVRMDSNGKVLLGGSAEDPDGPNGVDLAVVRFTADGHLDPTFNGTGKLIWPVVNNEDKVKDIVFGAQQRIYLVGEAMSSGLRRIVIGALNNDGTKYLEYGGNMTGRTILPVQQNVHGYVDRALMDSNGNIMVVGNAFLSFTRGMMAQVDPMGAYTSFNDSGVLLFGVKSQLHDILKVQGGYLVCGYYFDDDKSFQSSMVARISEAAQPVPSFADDGMLVENVNVLGNDGCAAFAAQGTGHVVVVGMGFVPGPNGFYGFAFRITVDGILTGSEEHELPRFRVYPNPTDGLLQLPGELPLNALVEVVDLRGAVVMTAKLDGTRQLDVRRLASGLYTLVVDRSMSARFVRN